VSPLRGEKPIFGPLSKCNTGKRAIKIIIIIKHNGLDRFFLLPGGLRATLQNSDQLTFYRGVECRLGIIAIFE